MATCNVFTNSKTSRIRGNVVTTGSLEMTFNKVVYSVLTQLQYIRFLVTCFGFYKTIFSVILTLGRYFQCVHILWDPIVFT